MTPVQLLVIGGSGFIGGRLVQAALAQGQSVAFTYATRQVRFGTAAAYQISLENADDNRLETCLEQTRPQTVIYNAAPAFAQNTLHHEVNLVGVQRTLQLLEQTSPEARFIYVSTNAVFGGGRGNYREQDLPDPELRQDSYRLYGATKAAGERRALDHWPNTIVARTSVVDGRDASGKPGPRLGGLVAALQEGRELVRFNDRFISPTLVDNLVDGLLEISQPAFAYRGVLHLAGSQRTSDYEYAIGLCRRLGRPESLVKPSRMNDVPAMAAGPRDTSLDVSFTQQLIATRLLGVDEQLARIFEAE